jgi:glycosyltransferase involved in cell wall biosynthesis
MDISVIIPTYNRKEVLRECLNLLNDQTASRESFEVILVDDGSSDGSEETVREVKKNYSFRYIYQKNQGQGAARNNGVNHGAGRIILFIDDDVLAHPSLIEEHRKLQKDQKNLIVRGPVINIPSIKIPGNRPVSFRDRSKNFFCTSNASVAKEHIIKAGMFDEDFQWWEDCELGFRLRMMGLRWIFSLDAVVFHYKPFLEDELGYIKKLSVKKGKNAVKLYKKHPHWRIKLATGIHWFSFFNAKIFNPFIIDFYEKIFNKLKEKFYYRSLLASQIGNYYYLKTIKEELKKTGQ